MGTMGFSWRKTKRAFVGAYLPFLCTHKWGQCWKLETGKEVWYCNYCDKCMADPKTVNEQPKKD